MSIFLLAQYVALAQLITGFPSVALCCSCQLCVTRGGGELRSLLCLSHGPELPVFSSFTYTSGSGIAESHGNSVFSFLRNCPIVSHSSCTILHSHQQCMRALILPHLCQHLVFMFLMIVILVYVKWCLIVISIDS